MQITQEDVQTFHNRCKNRGSSFSSEDVNVALELADDAYSTSNKKTSWCVYFRQALNITLTEQIGIFKAHNIQRDLKTGLTLNDHT